MPSDKQPPEVEGESGRSPDRLDHTAETADRAASGSSPDEETKIFDSTSRRGRFVAGDVIANR